MRNIGYPASNACLPCAGVARVYFQTMRSFWILLLAAAVPQLSARAADDLDRYSVIFVATASASIYIGRLTVTPGPFVRAGPTYKASLGVDLSPYFYHDDAKVQIEVPPGKLRALQAGKPIDFNGRVTRSNGQSRRIAGRAIPVNPSSGMIDIHVFLTSQVTISFSTTYQVAAPAR